MTTANLADALPRLQKIRDKTQRDVAVQLEVWVRGDRTEVEWSIYLPGARSRSYNDATLEGVIAQAEFAAGLVPTSGLPEVVLP